jgi:hypothetical protein
LVDFVLFCFVLFNVFVSTLWWKWKGLNISVHYLCITMVKFKAQIKKCGNSNHIRVPTYFMKETKELKLKQEYEIEIKEEQK